MTTNGERVFHRTRQQWATYISEHSPGVSSVVFDDEEEELTNISTSELEPAELCCTSDRPPCGKCIELYPTELNAHRFVPYISANPPGVTRSVGLAGKYSAAEADKVIRTAPTDW